MAINDTKSTLIGLMKSKGLDMGFIAEVVSCLTTMEQQLAMAIYLKENPEAPEDTILDTLAVILKNSRSS